MYVCIHEDSTKCHDCLVALRAQGKITWHQYVRGMIRNNEG
jgi:hypothetical protein